MPERGGRAVFVGNIPYGVSEEIIQDTLGLVGKVLSFRLVYDKDTGKPKGFGFAEFSEADEADAAVRNLNDYELQGRKLRVDYSNDGGPSDNNTQNPPRAMNGQDAPQQSQSAPLPPLPPGQELPPNIAAPDAISRTLSTLPPPQLLDILSQMKGLVVSDPAKATELLKQAPQLSYAIFQALLLLGLVDSNILTSVVEHSSAQQATPAPQPPPAAPPVQPPLQQSYMGYPQQYGNVPTPPVAQQYQAPPSQPVQPQQAAPAGLTPEIMNQLINMSQAQIDALDPMARGQIMALRQQLMASGYQFRA